MNAVHGSCRKQGALAKRVSVVIGRNDRNVGGRRLLVGDIDSDSEADAQANLPQAGSISNLPDDSDLDDAGGGGPETDPSWTQVNIHYLFIVTYSLVFMAYSLVFCT